MMEILSLVASDLYHREARSVKAARCLQEEVRRLDEAGIDVYAVYGNRSFGEIGMSSWICRRISMPALRTSLVSMKSRKGGVTVARILEFRISPDGMLRPLHAMLCPPDDAAINIGLLHTALDPKDPQLCSLQHAGFMNQHHMDYWALGHIHQPRIIRAACRPLLILAHLKDAIPVSGGRGYLLVELSQGRLGR